METKGGRLECYRFWFSDWWLLGRTKYVSFPWEVTTYSHRLNTRWPEVCFRFSSGLRYSLGCVRGCWCLSFQDHERQHSSSTPSLTRKHATTTVVIAVSCFRLERYSRFPLSRIVDTYSGPLLMHMYSSPVPFTSMVTALLGHCRHECHPLFKTKFAFDYST